MKTYNFIKETIEEYSKQGKNSCKISVASFDEMDKFIEDHPELEIKVIDHKYGAFTNTIQWKLKKMVNRLKNCTCYLSGPIDEAEDFTSWRNDISKFLWDMGCGVLDPCNKPFPGPNEDEQFRKELIGWKGTGEYDKLTERMRHIVTTDLHMVDMSTFVILHIDKKIHMCGSYFEACYGCLERKPLIVHCSQGKGGIPNWLFGIAKHNLFFSTWDEVKSYLKHINEDLDIDDLNGRWKFPNMSKIFNVDISDIYRNDAISRRNT